MKRISAMAVAALMACLVFTGCKTKKDDTVVSPTDTPRPTETAAPTPSPLLDTDKTIDDVKDDLEDGMERGEDELREGMDEIENDLDAGANVTDGERAD